MKFTFRDILLILAFTLALPTSTLKAQKWEAIASLGVSGYMGEYNPDNVFKFNSFAAGIGAKYNFNPTWGLRSSLAVIGIKGQNQHQNVPSDESFISKTLFELSFLPEFNFFKFEPNQSENVWSPYVFAGVGGIVFQQNNKTAMKSVIPFGAGFKYNLKGSWSLDSRLTYRITRTNKLDDYAAPRPQDAGTVRFVDKLNSMDSYMTFQVGVTYTFFKEGCPVW